MSDTPHHNEDRPEREQFTSDTNHASSSSTDAMRFLPDASTFRIQRWIGSRHSNAGVEHVSEPTRHKRNGTEWEMEEFEREVALRFVMRDLHLDLEGTATPQGKRAMSPWLRSQSSSATLQPLQPVHTRAMHAVALPPLQPSPPVSIFSSQSPLARSHSSPPHSSPPHSPTSPNSPLTPAPPRTPISYSKPGHTPITTSHLPPSTLPQSSTNQQRSPTTPDRDRSSLHSFFRAPSFTHKPSPSVLSLASHFSSCTSSASIASTSSRSHSLKPVRSPSFTASSPRSPLTRTRTSEPRPPPTSYRTNPNVSSPKALLELDASGMAIKKKRRISVPSFATKKRRLVVRGVALDDLLAVEGVRRWASGLGELKRICRAADGTLWIEFRDKKVAENVCVITAQVYIPHVGRVVLDWAEGRQPG